MYNLLEWKRTGIGVCLCLFTCISIFAANPDSLLKARIDTLLADKMPRGAEAGICIYDLSKGRTLYEYRADKLSRPASTMKVMTAITALATPGANRPFRTRLCTDGTQQGDTLKGNLYAVGDMDPEFDEDAMEELVAKLTEQGIRVVDGDIVGDVSLKDSLYWGEGWLWDDAPAAYQPYMSPLMLNKGVLQIAIRPDEPGFPAFVRGYPASTYYTFDNRTHSHSRGERPLKVNRDWMHHSNLITLTGNVSRSEGREMSLFDSGSFFLHVLTEKLMRAGIRCTAVADSTHEGIRAAYRFGQVPDSAVVELAAYETSFQAVLDEMLKESDNLNAEAVLCRTGAQATHKKKVLRLSVARTAGDHVALCLRPHRPLRPALPGVARQWSGRHAEVPYGLRYAGLQAGTCQDGVLHGRQLLGGLSADQVRPLGSLCHHGAERALGTGGTGVAGRHLSGGDKGAIKKKQHRNVYFP